MSMGFSGDNDYSSEYSDLLGKTQQLERIIEGQRQGIATAQEVIKVLLHHNDTLLKSNTYLRSCPRPPEPDFHTSGDSKWSGWHDAFEHYEAWLRSTPPEEFK